MADVSITIRKHDGVSETTIMVSGVVDDAALQPFTAQLAGLLSNTANSAASVPAPTPAVAPAPASPAPAV